MKARAAGAGSPRSTKSAVSAEGVAVMGPGAAEAAKWDPRSASSTRLHPSLTRAAVTFEELSLLPWATINDPSRPRHSAARARVSPRARALSKRAPSRASTGSWTKVASSRLRTGVPGSWSLKVPSSVISRVAKPRCAGTSHFFPNARPGRLPWVRWPRPRRKSAGRSSASAPPSSRPARTNKRAARGAVRKSESVSVPCLVCAS